jgi:hypothetical protein
VTYCTQLLLLLCACWSSVMLVSQDLFCSCFISLHSPLLLYSVVVSYVVFCLHARLLLTVGQFPAASVCLSASTTAQFLIVFTSWLTALTLSHSCFHDEDTFLFLLFLPFSWLPSLACPSLASRSLLLPQSFSSLPCFLCALLPVLPQTSSAQ